MNKKKDKKYSLDDLRNTPHEVRLVAVGVMIANEINSLSEAIRELKNGK